LMVHGALMILCNADPGKEITSSLYAYKHLSISLLKLKNV